MHIDMARSHDAITSEHSIYMHTQPVGFGRLFWPPATPCVKGHIFPGKESVIFSFLAS